MQPGVFNFNEVYQHARPIKQNGQKLPKSGWNVLMVWLTAFLVQALESG